MIKKMIITICALVLSPSMMVQAQSFQGIAKYEVRFIEKDLNDTLKKVSKIEMLRSLERKLAGPPETEYELLFNNKESVWRNVPSLKYAANEQYVYHNREDNESQSIQKISGKPFIVKESLQQLSWQITSEVREISGYTCRKAYLDDPKGEQKKVSVWFTEEIPVSSGPISFYGLPGLILLANDGDFLIRCTKVVLNPRKKAKIRKPKGGKVLSRTEFNELRKEKMKEVMSKKF